jgi:hypothetical protein
MGESSRYNVYKIITSMRTACYNGIMSKLGCAQVQVVTRIRVIDYEQAELYTCPGY